jgi:hypothetical protein
VFMILLYHQANYLFEGGPQHEAWYVPPLERGGT